jgi:hypothetical protein
MTTNTQPQTQQSGGDELEQMLKAFQHDVAATGYPMNTPSQDNILAGATAALKQLIQAREREAEQRGAQTVIELADARTINPLAPDHDNYIIKCYVVDEYLQQLQPQASDTNEAT